MKIIEKSLNAIKMYENNPRNNTEAIQYVANSIKEFGFKVPIVVDKNNVIVAGHTRYLASQKLGLEKVPCIVADDLNEEQVKAFRLADNRVSEVSQWDNKKLDEELNNILDIDMELFNFSLDQEELEEILEAEEKQLKPYSTVHYLISADINLNDKILDVISALENIEGIEIESTSN